MAYVFQRQSPYKKTYDSNNFQQMLQNLEFKINTQLDKLGEDFISKCLEQRSCPNNVQNAIMALNTLFSVDEEEFNYTWRQVVNKIKGYEKQFLFCTKQFFNLVKQNKYQSNQIKEAKKTLAKTKGVLNENSKKNTQTQREQNVQNIVELVENMLLYIDMIQTQKQQSRIQEQFIKQNVKNESNQQSKRNSIRKQESTVDDTTLRREAIGSPIDRNSLKLKDNSVDNTFLKKEEIESLFNRYSLRNKDNSVDNTVLVKEDLGSPINNTSFKNQDDFTDNSILRKDFLGSPKNNFNNKVNYFPSTIQEVKENQHTRYTYRPEINQKSETPKQVKASEQNLQRQNSASQLNLGFKDTEIQSQLASQIQEKVQVVSILNFEEPQHQENSNQQGKNYKMDKKQPKIQKQAQQKKVKSFRTLIREVKNNYKKPQNSQIIQEKNEMEEKIVNISEISKYTNSNNKIQTVQMDEQHSAHNNQQLLEDFSNIEFDISNDKIELIVPPQSPVVEEVLESKIKYLQNIIQQEKNDIRQLMTEQIPLRPIQSFRKFSPKKQTNRSQKFNLTDRGKYNITERHSRFQRENNSNLDINWIHGMTNLLKYQLYETELDSQYIQQQLQIVLDKLHTQTQVTESRLKNKSLKK